MNLLEEQRRQPKTAATNPIFKKNYEGYLENLKKIDLSYKKIILGIDANEATRTAYVPFFQKTYQVAPAGVVDHEGNRPDYGICVILLKYLLLSPNWNSTANQWINFRDLKDSGQSPDASLSEYFMQKISSHFTGKATGLKTAVQAIGGRPPETDYPYDVSAVFTALPRIPILLLYNDAERLFPAQTLVLCEQRAETFLDVECLIMICWYLYQFLKQGAQ